MASPLVGVSRLDRAGPAIIRVHRQHEPTCTRMTMLMQTDIKTVPTQMDAQLKERERAFHDDRFAGNVEDDRVATRKYYDSASAAYRRYNQLVELNANGSRMLEYGCGPDGHAFELHSKAVWI